MNYKNQYQRKAHREVDFIFLTLLPQAGLSVREEQVKLSHQMLDALLEGNIALCDAGVGIGKTYAYLHLNEEICGSNGKWVAVR